MAFLRAFRIMNALANGTLTANNLETLLTTDGRLGEWEQLLALRGQVRVLIGSESILNIVAQSTTSLSAIIRSPNISQIMTGIANSANIMTNVVASSNLINIIAASSPAMTAIAASNTAMTVCRDSVNAKTAFYENDTALNAILPSTTLTLTSALSLLRGANQYSVVSFTEDTANSVSISLTGNKYLLLGASRAPNIGASYVVATRRSGSTRSTSVTIGSTGTSNGAAVSSVIPITTPFSVTVTVGTANTGYLGLLRVDA